MLQTCFTQTLEQKLVQSEGYSLGSVKCMALTLSESDTGLGTHCVDCSALTIRLITQSNTAASLITSFQK